MNKNEILKIYGTDYREMTLRLLEAIDAASYIPHPDSRIGIKPNLVSPTPASYGATTHPEIIEGIIEYLQNHGFYELCILEGSWVGDKTEEAFEYCGYNSLSRKYNVPLIDTQKDKGINTDCSGLYLNICKSCFDIDFLINVPVLKGHCQTKITCALKNMKGLIPNTEKRRFHSMGLHSPIAHLNTAICQDLIIVDNICGDPDFEEGGNPVVTNCIMAARDPVLVDSYGCSLLGYKACDVPYIGLAESLKVGCSDIEKMKLSVISGKAAPAHPSENRVLNVSYAANEVDSCSACYAMLIPALQRLKNEGLLAKLNTRIAIGQGHRGRTGMIGVGNCTKGFKYSVKGCPPSEEDIYIALKEYILKL